MAKYTGDLQMEKEMAKLSWPEAPKIVTTEIPGPKSKVIFEKELANETPTRCMPNAVPCVWSEAFGATFKDPDGNVFIDLTGGVAVNNTGHSHPKVVEVIRKECGRLMHNPDAPNPHRQKLGEKLSQIVPGNLKGNVKVAYGLSGSSAVEMATKFARAGTGKALMLAFQGAYHGALGVTLSLTTSPGFRSNYRPFTPFIKHVGPYAYCYRCPFNLTYPGCQLACAKYVEYQITGPYSGIDREDVAALIVEPMQGEGGYVPTPAGWLEYIRNMCKRLGILYIDDEVQVGMARTGKMFAVEHYGVEPDMITLGKALGGDLPCSAVIARKDIVKDLKPFSHVLTAAGNATSCAVACTNIDLLQDGLVERTAKLGDYVLGTLKEIADEREVIGDVRGMGLGIAIELVKNRETKEPLKIEEMLRILFSLRDKGVLALPCGRFDNVLRIMPPLVISKEHLDKALEIISEVLGEVEGDILG
jgi:4-aminobutyrate aminotransferase